MKFETGISSDRFSFYADNFALAAESGLLAVNSLTPAVDGASRVDFRTFEIARDVNAVRNVFVVNLKTSYESVFINASSTNPMTDAFNHLSQHIHKFFNMNVNDYLSNNNIKVTQTYASLSAVFGEAINEGNIA